MHDGMSPAIETTTHVILLVVAVWLIREGYLANKTAVPFSRKTFLSGEFGNSWRGGYAIIGGVGLLFLLLIKFLSCGVVCGTFFPS